MAKKNEKGIKGSIDLGDRVRDKVTGFEGVVITRAEFINGCTRFGVQSQTLKDGMPTDATYFDEPQLTLLEKMVVPVPHHKLRIVEHTKEQLKAAGRAKGGPMSSIPKRHADVKSR